MQQQKETFCEKEENDGYYHTLFCIFLHYFSPFATICGRIEAEKKFYSAPENPKPRAGMKEYPVNILSQIPPEFYKLFSSKYMDYYIRFLVSLYRESSRSYSLLGLTEDECRGIMNEQLAAMTLDWSEERFDEEGELLTRANMASVSLKHFEDWGWLVRDFDETLNSYVVSFPEYSQQFVDLFARLSDEDESQERESILAIYSHLYTYQADPEKNNEILKSALHTSRSLLQMLANMQEGMRGYFDELSKQKSFIGIQEVLVKEINNSDSEKYAILTTTDSFYRYKEAVKELLDQNLRDNEIRRQDLLDAQVDAGEDTPAYLRASRGIAQCEEAVDLLNQISRQFDIIERRYNQLIEQKTVFASRAAARIRYIQAEGAEEDSTLALISLISKSDEGRQEEILGRVAETARMTEPYRLITPESFYRPREREGGFQPAAVPEAQPEGQENEQALDAFVLRPLYTGQEIQDYYQEHETDGVFHAAADAVNSVEDLEKLYLVWQEAAENADSPVEIEIGEDQVTSDGLTYSDLIIRRKEQKNG